MKPNYRSKVLANRDFLFQSSLSLFIGQAISHKLRYFLVLTHARNRREDELSSFNCNLNHL